MTNLLQAIGLDSLLPYKTCDKFNRHPMTLKGTRKKISLVTSTYNKMCYRESKSEYTL